MIFSLHKHRWDYWSEAVSDNGGYNHQFRRCLDCGHIARRRISSPITHVITPNQINNSLKEKKDVS